MRDVATNLPLQLKSFIGRERDLSELQRSLSLNRLITLCGPGGCGKTRLALQVAGEALERFADGVWFVELAMVSDAALVPHAVARTLEREEQPGRSMAETLTEYLHDREMLLILDNCEQVVSACAELVESLLRTCPRLRLLVTSREVLDIAGEACWLVMPLSLPIVEDESVPPEEYILRYEATRLFVERATAILPAFSLTRENALTIVQLCSRLDGIPLAIELAAARVKMLSLDQIAARLDDSFHLLTSGHRTAFPHQQTLRATMDWSYELLTEPERSLLCRLALFAGSFTLEAAEVICAGDDLGSDAVLDTLTHLVNKSLVLVKHSTEAIRYYLLETTRQYGMEKLQMSGELADGQRRHCDWYERLAQRLQLALMGPGQRSSLEQFEMEHDNLRAALSWLREQGDWEKLLLMAAELWIFWATRGHLSEGRQWLEIGLTQSKNISCPVRARASTGMGTLTAFQGDFVQADRWLEQSMELSQQVEGKAELALALYYRGYVAERQGEYVQAKSWLEMGLALFRELEDRRGIAMVTHRLGGVAGKMGNLQEISVLYQESLELRREIGDSMGIAQSLHNLGFLAFQKNEYSEALTHFQESLQRYRVLGHKRGIATCLHNLGCIALRQNDFAQSRTYLEQGMKMFWQIGDRANSLTALEALAAIAGAQQDCERAARLWGAAEAFRLTHHTPLEPFDLTEYTEMVAAVRVQANPILFAKNWAEGQQMSLDEAVMYALTTPAESLNERIAPAGRERKRLGRPHLPADLHIFALGQTQVYRGNYALTSSDWTYTKCKELLFYLLCHRHTTKEQIGLALWPDASPTQLRNNFRVTVYYLRHALGRPEWIMYDGKYYAFNRQLSYWSDSEFFEDCLSRAQQYSTTSTDRELHFLEEAIKLYRGDFLADVEAGEWFLLQRETFQRQYLEALFLLGRRCFELKNYPRSTQAFRQIISHDSYHEAAHRELMRCYARQGERHLAIKCYQSLLARMRDELGFSPEPETTALFEKLRQGEE